MMKFLKAAFVLMVMASAIAAFPVVGATGSEGQPKVEFAVLKTMQIEGLQHGLLAGPERTIEVNHGGPAIDGFAPNSSLVWGCRTVEDLMQILVPEDAVFQVLVQEKFMTGECFRASPGNAYAVERLEKMTSLPAKGDRPELVIWSARDSQGAIAYSVWSPDIE